MTNETKPSGLPEYVTQTEYEVRIKTTLVGWQKWASNSNREAMIEEAKVCGMGCGYGRAIVIEVKKSVIFDTTAPA